MLISLSIIICASFILTSACLLPRKQFQSFAVSEKCVWWRPKNVSFSGK
jgi:hypothetical protein